MEPIKSDSLLAGDEFGQPRFRVGYGGLTPRRIDLFTFQSPFLFWSFGSLHTPQLSPTQSAWGSWQLGPS